MATANGNPNQKLTGINPLAYMGVEATTPPQMIVADSIPTSGDSKGFQLGTFWLVKNTTPQQLWILTNLDEGVATWTLLSPGAASIQTITGNSGGAVGPDGADNVTLVGSGGVTVAGNPGTNTLTISSAASSGSMVLIQTQIIDSFVAVTNVDFTIPTTTYTNFVFKLWNIGTGAGTFTMQLSTDGGSTFWNDNDFSSQYIALGGTTWTSAASGTNQTIVTILSATNGTENGFPASLTLNCYGLNSNNDTIYSGGPTFDWMGQYLSVSAGGLVNVMGFNNASTNLSSTPINFIRFSSNFASSLFGSFSLYGLVV